MSKFGLLVFIMLFLSVGSYADETLDFKRLWEYTIRETKLSKENENCRKLWGSLNGFALWDTPYKYKARRRLYNYLLPKTISETALIPPVMNGENDITRLKHAVILAVHSKPGLIQNERYPALDLIKRFLPDTIAKEEFIICAQSDPSKDCATILVNAKEVPSYDEYHTETQMLSPRILTSRCGKQIEINFNKKET